jgi:hypothetical protein
MITKKRYTLVVDMGKPYDEECDTLDEVKKIMDNIEKYYYEKLHNESPYCDFMLIDNEFDIELIIEEWIK